MIGNPTYLNNHTRDFCSSYVHKGNPVEVREVSVQRRLDSDMCSGEGRYGHRFHLKLLLSVSLSLTALRCNQYALAFITSAPPRALANSRIANHELGLFYHPQNPAGTPLAA